MSKPSLLAMLFLLVGLCATPSRALQGQAVATPPPVAYQNDVLGVQVRDTLGLRVVEDGMLAGDSTWGFSLVKTENGGNGALVLSVSLVYQASPDVDRAVAEIVAANPQFLIHQVGITVDGIPGKALFGLPSMSGATYIYLASHQQLYRILYASDTLDDRGEQLLHQLHFIQPTRTLASLHLKRAADEALGIAAQDTFTATQVITAPHILPYRWSPDGSSLTYWTFTAAEAKEWRKGPPGTLHIVNVRTGQNCAIPYPIGYRSSPLVWLPNGKILTVTDARAANAYQVLLGTPCTDDLANVSQQFPTGIFAIEPYKADNAQFVLSNKQGYWLYTPQTQTIHRIAATVPDTGGMLAGSPSGAYFSVTSIQHLPLATTYVIELSTDQVQATIQWQVQRDEGGEFAIPLWLNEDQFLIPETVDQGPLLVTLGQKPASVASQRFGLPPRPLQRVSAAPLVHTPYHHWVFSSPATDQAGAPRLPLRLYHSATGKVEELPFQQLISTPGAEPFTQRLGFSPDGRWLLGFADPSANIWLWPVDGPSEEEVQLPLHGASSPLVWKPDSTQLAVGGYGGITLFGVPGGEQVGFINIGDYSAEPFGWSPDGKFLAIHGTGYGYEALFVLPIDPNSQATVQGQRDKPPTLTKASLITSTLVPTATAVISTHVLLRLEGQEPASLVLDQQAIYWVAWPGLQKLYRYPFVADAQTPATITVVATSHYPEGVLGQYPLLRTGGWLIFYDSAYDAISDTWQLRALNLTNGTEQILAESKGTAIVYGIAAANNRVVWSWLDHQAERACQDEAVLSSLDLTTNQPVELNRACFQTEHHWRAVSMDGDRLVAEFWQEQREPEKMLGDIVLFDLSAPDPTQFTVLKASSPARQNSLPRLTGQWVSWVRGAQNQGNCVLFNLQTQTQQALPTEWNQTNCQFVDAGDGWFLNLDDANTKDLLLYQPDQQRNVRLHLHTQGQVGAAALMDNTVVVAVRLYPEQLKVIKSVIEWTHLDQP